MSNSLLSSAVIAVIIVIVSGYVISYSVGIDTVADIVFTGMLDSVYATHGVLSLIPTDSIDDTYVGLDLDGAASVIIFESDGNTYAAVTSYADDSVQILDITDPYDITAAGSITDTDDLVLDGANRIAIFNSHDNTYAAVSSESDSGVQILDITDPYDITAAGNIVDNDDLVLRLSADIAIFESDDNTYAAVPSFTDNGVQILDITDPYRITPAGSITDDDNTDLLRVAQIDTFELGVKTYAAVTSGSFATVQILDITYPYDITAKGSINSTNANLSGVQDITTFESGIHTYAAVTSHSSDDYFSILNVTDPSNITKVRDIIDDGDLKLGSPREIAIFNSRGNTYAVVTAQGDDGVQILNITDPSTITAAGSIDDADGADLKLDGANGIAIFESGDRTYAAVAAEVDNGVQILDITDSFGPEDIIPAADNIGDQADTVLSIANGIATFESDGNTYAAVTSSLEDGVQVLDITDPYDITLADSITDDGNMTALRGAHGITTFKSGANTYAAVAAPVDNGVQILDVTDPYNITPADSIVDVNDTINDPLTLIGATSITMFESGVNTYVVAGSPDEHGFQILDVTNPSNIDDAGSLYDDAGTISDVSDITTFKSGGKTYVAFTSSDLHRVHIMRLVEIGTGFFTYDVVGSITDNDDDSLTLKGASSITTFESGTDTYAAVTARLDNGVQILNITDSFDPGDIIPAAGSINGTYDANLKLKGANDITIFESGGTRYAAVASIHDGGVQILNITDPYNIAPIDSITDDGNTKLKGAHSIATFESGGYTHVAVVGRADHGVQIIRIGIGDDITPPRINITGPPFVTISVGDSYDDQDVTCTDNADPSPTLTSDIVVGTPSQVGYHIVTYSCADASENMAEQVTRTVIVQLTPDIAAPEILIVGNNPATIIVGTLYNDKGATCSDDGNDITTRIIFVDTVDPTAAGTYAVAYSCADVSGNQTIKLRTVIVQAMPGTPPDTPPDTPPPDTAPPIIIILGDNPATITAGTSYDDDGAFCFDAVDGILEPESTINVDVDVAGQHTVTYSCADVEENRAVELRTVIVQPTPDTPPPAISDTGSPSQRRSGTQNYLIVDTNITIDGQSYSVGSGTLIKPHDVVTGQATDIAFTAYSASDIIHFTVYLNLHGNDVAHSNSDTYISYDHGTVQTHDPHGFISDASITVTEDSEQPIKNIIDTLVEFDGKMGLTNMVVHIWNDDRRSELIKVLDALEITSGTGVLPDPEPQILPDPEPQILPDPEPQILPDPEPQNYNGTAVTTPPDTELSDAETLSIIRMWAGFEHGTVTDDELLQALNLDYHDNRIPNWVMTELAVLVSKGNVTADEFVLALQYVLTHA